MLRAAAAGFARWAVRSRARLVGTVTAALLALWLTVGLVAPTALVSVSVAVDDHGSPSEVMLHNRAPLGIETGPASMWLDRFEDGRWQRLPGWSALSYGVELRPGIGRWETAVPVAVADALEPGRYRVVLGVHGVRRDLGEGVEVRGGFEVTRPQGWERGVPPPGPEQGVWWLHG